MRSLGFFLADQLLASGSLFLQPSGYGEGFQHSLADAIVSDMTLLISRQDFFALRAGAFGCEVHVHRAGVEHRCPVWVAEKCGC